jgi:hypothetical protein
MNTDTRGRQPKKFPMSWGTVDRQCKMFLEDFDIAATKFIKISTESAQTVKDAMNNRLKIKRLLDDSLIPTNRHLEDISEKQQQLELEFDALRPKLLDMDRLLRAQTTKAAKATLGLKNMVRMAIQEYPMEVNTQPIFLKHTLIELFDVVESRMNGFWKEYLLRESIMQNIEQLDLSRKNALTLMSIWNHFPYIKSIGIMELQS